MTFSTNNQLYSKGNSRILGHILYNLTNEQTLALNSTIRAKIKHKIEESLPCMELLRK